MVERNKGRNKRESKSDECRRIGIFGLHPGAGATFLSVSCAEYLAGSLGCKVFVFEGNQRSDLWQLKKSTVKHLDREDGEEFTLHGITYRKLSEHRYCMDPMNKTPDYSIFDLGCCYDNAKVWFGFCDLLLFIFHLSEWKFQLSNLRKEQEMLLRQEIVTCRNYTFIGNLMEEKEGKELDKYGIHAKTLGLERSVFCPSTQAVVLYDSILFHGAGMVEGREYAYHNHILSGTRHAQVT